MELVLDKKREIRLSVIFDVLGIAAVYYLPALSHLLAFPLYYADPMRLVLILAMAHTHRYNAVFLAVTLSLTSFFITSHPVLLKSALISFELLVNTALFYALVRKQRNVFLSGVISIGASKIIYYLIKYLLISGGMLQMSLFSTPVWVQIAAIAVFSGYLWFVLDYKTDK